MKKQLVFATGLLAAGLAMAANTASKAVMEFYTKGPDTYQDGQPVQEGEKYLFAYIPAGSTFQGVNADGTLAGDAKLVGTSSAFNGSLGPRCAYQCISYDLAEYPEGGSFLVILLDTRINGVTGGLVDAYEAGEAVRAGNGTSIKAAKAAETAEVEGNVFAAAAVKPAISLLNAEENTPVITDIVPAADGTAEISIANLSPKGTYTVMESDDISSGWQAAEAPKLQTKAAEGSISIAAPKDGAKVRFFKVYAK